MSELEMRKVKSEEFFESLKSLDEKGTYPLSVSSGNNQAIFYENGKPVGYVVSSEDYSRVAGFTVHQDYRGRGYGRRMIEILKQNASEKNRELVVCDPIFSSDFFKKCNVKIEWPMFDDGL
ncbi:hypothetical protein A3K64_04110 [Candidatus Micrarchaeota archaeon RBG_16_36_9]|nr:MAG: hypothetical protein A3K64_04110 [Candidatus Micrarchaeota archaeon RBG_16_36_9]